MAFFIICLISFFLGALPVGFLVARAQGVDIQSEGSGNTGATNVGRVLGKKAGILTLVADIGKGILAAFLLPIVVSVVGSEHFPSWSLFLGPLVGYIAVFGHCYSPFLKFKGGKGVATALGVFFVFNPLVALVSVAMFGVVLKGSGYVALSSMVASLTFPLVYTFSGIFGEPDGFVSLASFATAGLIFFRHRANISRLKEGTEPRFSDKYDGDGHSDDQAVEAE